MNTSEVLDLAADEIERRGWAKGFLGGDPWGGGAGSDRPVCLEGAIAAAAGLRVSADPEVAEDGFDSLAACPAYVSVHRYLNLGPRDSVWEFNDEAADVAEVIGVLRAAAMVERTREAAAERISA